MKKKKSSTASATNKKKKAKPSTQHPRPSGAISAIFAHYLVGSRFLAKKFFEGGRLIRLESGLDAYEDAFKLDRFKVNDQVREILLKPLQEFTKDKALRYLGHVYDCFIEAAQQLRDDPAGLLAFNWACHCVSSAIDFKTVIPDSDPFYLPPLSPDATPPMKKLYPILVITSSIHAAEYAQATQQTLEERLSKITEHKTKLIADCALEFMRAAQNPNMPTDQREMAKTYAEVLGALAIAVDEKDEKAINDLMESIPKEYRDLAEERLKNFSPYPIQ